MNEEWSPSKELIDSGWHFFSFVNRGFDKDLQLKRFLNTITIETKYGEEMYVRAFLCVPENENPGGGFVQVGFSSKEETDIKDFEQVFERKTGRGITSILALPGHCYIPSTIVHGQFERVPGNYREIWAR